MASTSEKSPRGVGELLLQNTGMNEIIGFASKNTDSSDAKRTTDFVDGAVQVPGPWLALEFRPTAAPQPDWQQPEDRQGSGQRSGVGVPGARCSIRAAGRHPGSTMRPLDMDI